MRLCILSLVIVLGLAVGAANAEEQVFDSSGKLVEIRQQYGDTTYAYSAARNYIYSATNAGNGGVLEYRDKWGVGLGLRGPGLHWQGNTIPLPGEEK